MRKYCIIVYFQIFIVSCASWNGKHIINDKTFKSPNYPMIGSTSIKFSNDSIFYLEERGGMLYSQGIWKWS